MARYRCNGVFSNYTSTGPRWDKGSGRFVLVLKADEEGSKDLRLSYARYMMCVHLGRVLETEEEVDHIDGDRTHDVITNLQILTKSENSKKTSQDPLAIARRKKVWWFICPHCKTRFERPKSRSHLASGGNATYCSKVCGSYSKLYIDHKQECGPSYIDFTPKNYAEPWENWSTPVPVAIRSTGKVTRKKKFTTCRWCRKPFPAERDKIYCDDNCARKARSANVPSEIKMKGIVQRILNGKASWASVGRDYGVSDNAVRKWAKKYNLL